MRFYIFELSFWASCLFALFCGGWSERATALIYMADVELSHLVLTPLAIRYQHVETGVLIVDAAAFAGFLIVALLSRKFWPLWFTSMQGVILICHVAPITPGVIPHVSGNAVQLWSYPMLALLAAATAGHWQTKRRRKTTRS